MHVIPPPGNKQVYNGLVIDKLKHFAYLNKLQNIDNLKHIGFLYYKKLTTETIYV